MSELIVTGLQPRTNMMCSELDESVNESSNIEQHGCGTWGTRPLSAGPFHRPNLSETNKISMSANCYFPPEDPVIPIIDAIKQELTKFASK